MDNQEQKINDVIIIGGGPAGTSAAIYSARSKLKTLVIDKSIAEGAMGLAQKIENYPGILEPETGRSLLSRFRKQAMGFGAEFIESKVIGVDFKASPKEVFTGDSSYFAKAVIIATGARGRKPTIKGEAEFIGKGVAYCAACDAAFFNGRDVAVTGDGVEMFDDIDSISKFARKIYLVTHRKEFDTESAPRVKNNPKIEPVFASRVSEISGDTFVNKVAIENTSGVKTNLDVSGIFVYLHGNQPITDFLRSQLETDAEGCLKINKENMSASIEGVYAIGDVTCKKVRQAVTSAAEGCIAALSAEKFINQRAKITSQWG
ncbi:MAG: FAD-dependent oxidoreductase [Planctomycetes bacterium]|nr:FAD-dependent oxidoreductase [Planctomycetota bacterium]